jgi:hypothetical protein
VESYCIQIKWKRKKNIQVIINSYLFKESYEAIVSLQIKGPSVLSVSPAVIALCPYFFTAEMKRSGLPEGAPFEY